MGGYGRHPACIPPQGCVSALASPWKRAGDTWQRSGASRWTERDGDELLLTSVLVSRSNLQEQEVLADREGVCRKGLTSAPDTNARLKRTRAASQM
jgi:hypothetical protein